MHQSLLTSLTSTSANEDGNTGAIRTWEQVKPLLKTRNLHNKFGPDPFNDSLNLVHMDTGFPYKSGIRQQYDAIEDYLRVVGAPEGRTVIHPCSAERMGTEHKLGDIRELWQRADASGYQLKIHRRARVLGIEVFLRKELHDRKPVAK